MKNIFIILIIVLFGCSTQQSKISEEEVKEVINGMFYAISTENDNPDLIYEYVTDDYILNEMGTQFNTESFLDLIATFNAIEDDWVLSDMKISTDYNSAHISLANEGRFVVNTDTDKTVLNYSWLESAYLVKQDGKLKIKFYFSDQVGFSQEKLLSN